MNFQKMFLDALHSDAILLKSISVKDYLPTSFDMPERFRDNLPYIQAYSSIQASYPYHYELSNLASFCIIYTEEGEGRLLLKDSSYDLLPGTIAFINCRVSHRIEIKRSSWHYKALFFDGATVSFYYQTYMEMYHPVHTLASPSNLPNLVLKLFVELRHEHAYYFLYTKLLMDILSELEIEKEQTLSPAPYVPPYLISIKNLFDQDYNRDISLTYLESVYHVSKYRLCREFTKYYGISPIQYLLRTRITAAQDMLRHSSQTITEIGHLIGFENTNQFIRIFKQQTGVTPLVFRKHAPVTL